RDRRVRDQGRGRALLLEREAGARERQGAEALAPRGQRELDSLTAFRERAGLDDLACEADHDPARRSGRLNDSPDDGTQQLVDVVRCGQGLAEARGRVAEAASLGVELGQASLELVGHFVEGDPEARELVSALYGDALVEPPARDGVRGVREPA